MNIIDGKKIASEIKSEIAEATKALVKENDRAPHLAVILVGTDGGSETYVNHKVKSCKEVGFKSTLIRYEEQITETELLAKIVELNNDDTVDGFLVQLPLPKHISEQKVIEAIAPEKDVDGFHPVNTGRMTLNLPAYTPATPAGIIELLRRYNIETSGKNCVVVGRSNIVGTPVSILLSRKANPGDATVTVCHSRTPDVAAFTKKADIIIVALGIPGYLTADMVSEGAVVIDVGTTRVKSDKTKSGWKLRGDVDYDNVAPKCSYITPVPGGVGPMTIVSLLQNTLKAYKKEVY